MSLLQCVTIKLLHQKKKKKKKSRRDHEEGVGVGAIPNVTLSSLALTSSALR